MATSRINKYVMVNLLRASLAAWLLLGSTGASAQIGAPPKPPPEEEQPTIRVEVDVVNIFFSVRNKKGSYIADLEKNAFEIFEDGKKQDIKFFSRETDLPLTIGLLVDVSRSQENLIQVEKSASLKFFSQILRPKDMAFIISFGADAELLQDFTNSTNLLRKGLDQLRLNAGAGGVITPSTIPIPGGSRGTVLYEAVWLAAKDKLRNEVGRKAVIVITDGVDFGSRIKIEKAIEEAQRSDTIIYSVMFEDPRYTTYGGYSGEGPMRRMAEETGGRMFRVDRRNTLESIYAEIDKEMRSQYTIAYTPANPNKDGSFRKIEIKPLDKDYKAQARKGYYSSSTD